MGQEMKQVDLDALDVIVGAATKGEIEVVQRFANRWDLQVSVPGFIPRVLGHSSLTICEVGCGTDEEAKANALAWAALKNNYDTLAAELREARKRNEKAVGWQTRAQEFENLAALLREQLQGQKARVEELEAEMQVRDNSANETLWILREALPNRGFHSEMEAAEAIKKEMDALKVRLAVYDVALSQIYWKSLPMGDDRGNSDIADIAGDALKGDTSRLNARDRRMKAKGAAEWIQQQIVALGELEYFIAHRNRLAADAKQLEQRAAELEAAGEGEGNG